jgi:hypothetical protein
VKRALSFLLAWTVVLATPAGAELSQQGNLFVHFDGGVSPKALPRSTPAPIGVRIEGRIQTLSGARPPALRRIRIALNRAGRLETRGLPVCRPSEIEFVTGAEALAACGDALVGAGGIVARTDITGQENALIRGEVLLFNGLADGRPAILAHVFQRKPALITRLVVFHIQRSSGGFGTVITGELPPSLNRNGYLISIFLQLQRRYAFRGRQMSYISAGCAAPPGFSAAVFPFAKVSMAFSDGHTLASTLTRSCKVRD